MPKIRETLFRIPIVVELWELPDRKTVFILSWILGLLFVLLMTLFLDPHGRMAELFLDRNSPHFRYPFTIQNMEHLIFFFGMGELYVRWRVGKREMSFLDMNLLPEEESAVLESNDLGPIRRRVSKMYSDEHGFLPSLIDLCILQFQSGRSVDQTVAVMSSSLELIQHRVDLRYSIIRYVAWVVPTLGFIGTVIGLGASLASVPESGAINMAQLAHTLAVGFDCTMVALVESAILVFALHIIQEQEELSVNFVGTYTLRNLINRLYVKNVAYGS